MQAANTFQALPRAVNGPTSIPQDLLAFISGGKGDPAPPKTPSLPKGTW